MKKPLPTLIFCLCAVFGATAQAQNSTPSEVPLADVQGINLQAERARIQQERQASLQAYRLPMKNCYQKIAVNLCKMDAQQQKNTIDNDLKRQELLLNNYQRQQLGSKAIDRLEEKQSVEKQIDAEDKRIEYRNSQLDKWQENLDKNEAYLEKQEQIERNRESYQNKAQELKERQRKQQEKAVDANKKRADYQKKLDEADKHRQQVENDNASRNQPPPAPLPVPRPQDIPQ
jgi:chromosome segregation ATPase